MNKKLLIVVVILICFLLLARMFFKPYNNVELNAATIYYQSYSQLYRSVKDYVRMLENYNETKDKIYLERALIKIDAIRDNIIIFKLANQIDFRDTFINEKVVKTDFLDDKMRSLQFNYDYSWDVLKEFLEDNRLEDKTFQDFLHYNQLILSGLTTEDIGFHKETKEFRVLLDDSKRPLLEEGLTGLEEIVKRVTAP